MLNTIIMLIIVCVLATLLLLDFAILIPKFGAEHFGLPAISCMTLSVLTGYS